MKSSATSSSAIAMSAQFSRKKISGNVSLSLMPSTTAAVRRRGSTLTCDVSQPSRASVSTQEAAQRVVADARDHARRCKPEPRAAERGVRRRAAEVLGEARDVLEPRADLLRVEVDGEAAEADDVERRPAAK